MVLLATAAYVSAGTWILRDWAPAGMDWQGAIAGAVAVLAAAIAAHFGPGLDGLRRLGKTAMDALALALWCAAGILAVVAIALQFDSLSADNATRS